MQGPEDWRGPRGDGSGQPSAADDGGPSSQDTAEMPRVTVLDPSWWVLLVAALVSFAFLVGVMLGGARARSFHSPLPSSAPVAEDAIEPYRGAVEPAGARMGSAELGEGYYMGASTSPERPPQPPLALPASAAKIYYHYSLPGWPVDARIDFRWSLRGKTLPLDGVAWRPSQDGAWAQGYFELLPPGGAATFAPGIYEVELSGRSDFREVGSFAVVQGLEGMMAQKVPPGGLLVGRPIVALEADNQGRPTKPVTQVPPSVSKLYACFTYDGAVPGTVLVVRWFYEEVEVEAARSELRLPAGAGQACGVLQLAKGPLPVGKWKVAIYSGGVDKPAAETSFVVTEKATVPQGAGRPISDAQPPQPAQSATPSRRPSAR